MPAMLTRLTELPADSRTSPEREYQRLKVRLHEKLVDSLNLALLAQLPQEELEREVRLVGEELIDEELTRDEQVHRERLLAELVDEVFGLGPLESLFQDPDISDILVNNSQEVFVERHGRLEPTTVVFADEAHLVRIIQRIASRIGRRVDEVNPMVDARLADGSRVNAVIRPLAIDGPNLSIRRFRAEPFSLDDLVDNGTMTEPIARFLTAAVSARCSLLVSGGTGAGKTTLLNALAQHVPEDERLITIEDAAELRLRHCHVIRLETRPTNTEGTGEITQRALVRNSLRMRPDRIIVGEVRGAEALDMLQAMNTGHEGSLTTIHANDTRDALARLELMVAMAGFELPVNVVREYVAFGIQLLVHVSRLKGGVRRVTRVSELSGVEDGRLKVRDLFVFKQTGLDADGRATGTFVATGEDPLCRERIEAIGEALPAEMLAR